MEEGSSGAEATKWLYVAMGVVVTVMGVLVATGLFVPATAGN